MSTARLSCIIGDEMSGHVFMSYASADCDQARILASGLESTGVEVWRDKESLLPGEIWTEALVEAIRNGRGVVAVGSRSAFESYHVKRELHIALDDRKRIVPLMMEDCVLPPWARYILAGTHRLETPRKEVPARADEVCRALRRAFDEPGDCVPAGAALEPDGRSFRARLTVLDGNRRLYSGVFDRDVITIGRNRRCDLVPRCLLPEQEQQLRRDEILRQSKTHIYLRWQQGAYHINDVSAWGTLVNGMPVEDIVPLKNSDVIAMGNFEIVFTLEHIDETTVASGECDGPLPSTKS